MVQAAAPRHIDQLRMSRVMIAILDGDMDSANSALQEANREDAVHLLIASFAQALGVAMVAPAMSEEGRRKAFDRVIFDAQTHDFGATSDE